MRQSTHLLADYLTSGDVRDVQKQKSKSKMGKNLKKKKRKEKIKFVYELWDCSREAFFDEIFWSDTELREGIRMTSDDFEKIFFNGCTITPLIQHSLDKVDGFRLKVRQVQRGTRDSQKFSNKCRVKDFLWDVTTQVWHTNYGKRKCIPFIVKLINKLVILNTNIEI